MNVRKLTEYLAIIVDMEKDIFMRERTLKELEKKANSLAISRDFRAPVAPKSVPNNFARYLLFIIMSVAMIVIGVYLARDFFEGFFQRGSGKFILGIFFGPFLFLMCAALIICGIAVFINIMKEFFDDKKLVRKYEEDVKQYNQALQKYRNEQAADQVRVAQEAQKKAVIQNEIRLLRAGLSESRQRLSEMYSLNIIYPKYRNLAMVCSIYEYLRAGRCTILEGHEGAYNILENEIRLDRIVSQTNQILMRLDAIRDNQWALYSAVIDGQKTYSRLVSATDNLAKTMDSRLSSIEQNSAIAAYNLERTQKELAYMNRMNYYSGQYSGGTMFDIPPTL